METVFITGANKGIGFETARQLAQKDYYVYLGCRNLENGRHAVQKNSFEDAKNKIQPRFDKLDILINNAGIRGDYPQFPSTANIEVIRQVYDTNLFGTIYAIRSFLNL